MKVHHRVHKGPPLILGKIYPHPISLGPILLLSSSLCLVVSFILVFLSKFCTHFSSLSSDCVNGWGVWAHVSEIIYLTCIYKFCFPKIIHELNMNGKCNEDSCQTNLTVDVIDLKVARVLVSEIHNDGKHTSEDTRNPRTSTVFQPASTEHNNNKIHTK